MIFFFSETSSGSQGLEINTYSTSLDIDHSLKNLIKIREMTSERYITISYAWGAHFPSQLCIRGLLQEEINILKSEFKFPDDIFGQGLYSSFKAIAEIMNILMEQFGYRLVSTLAYSESKWNADVFLKKGQI